MLTIDEATGEVSEELGLFKHELSKFSIVFNSFKDETEAYSKDIQNLRRKKEVNQQECDDFYALHKKCRYIMYVLGKLLEVLNAKQLRDDLKESKAENDKAEEEIAFLKQEIAMYEAKLNT